MKTLSGLLAIALVFCSPTLNAADDQPSVSHPCPLSTVTVESYLELKNTASKDMHSPLREINCYMHLLSDADSDQSLLVSVLSLGKPEGTYSSQEYFKFIEDLCVNNTKFLLDAMNMLDETSQDSVLGVLQSPLVTDTAVIDQAMSAFREEASYAAIIRKYFKSEI